MYEVRKVDVLSMAKIYAVIMAIIGFIMGIVMAVIFLTVGSFVPAATGPASFGLLPFGLGVLSIIAFPILYGVLGFVMGAIGAFLYNVIAGWIGGVQLDLQGGRLQQSPPQPARPARKKPQ
ncbi:MAG: hypothetical protein HY518_05780 [Candidatus Aenigmarchaeota archaeon]|nr:hypothetical protein [Candidatus Aenigmarchaeota archaeon]